MRIDFHRTFKKRYAKSPENIQRAFDTRLTRLLADPRDPLLNLHPLSGNRAGQWSINVTGDWRAIFIYADEGTLVFVALDTHSNLYG